jgi:hypothetical protein
MPIAPEKMVLLKTVLRSDFVPHLPPQLKPSSVAEEVEKKDVSRAFAAYALSKVCEIDAKTAALAVVDDGNDDGIDAVYYQAASETIYLVQAKLKAKGYFDQSEAQAFCQGIRRFVAQDFSHFNQHFQARETELSDAIESCSNIVLVLAHVGEGVSVHADGAMNALLADQSHGEERFAVPYLNYDEVRAVADLHAAKAYPRVDATLVLLPASKVEQPRTTYFGLVPVSDLVVLHKTHDKALYAKNIRTYLGKTTDVNRAIAETLKTRPDKFAYLNNGVTALCEVIEPKESRVAGKRLKLTGFSVINGAQTVASSARFVQENPEANISDARVMLTLIQADEDGDFGKAVTRARNHQNPVLLANFAALDDEQERLRCATAILGIHYAYKAEGPDGINDPNRIRIDEAAHALALTVRNPRYAVFPKKEPGRLLDTEGTPYKVMFNADLSAIKLINAVRFFRYLQSRMATEAKGLKGPEGLTYKHGVYAVGFVLAKQLRDAIGGTALIDPDKLRTEMSVPFDAVRAAVWDQVEKRVNAFGPGPLAQFRNLGETIPLLQKVMIGHFGLTQDPAIPALKTKPDNNELFKYLASKAPQIANVT